MALGESHRVHPISQTIGCPGKLPVLATSLVHTISSPFSAYRRGRRKRLCSPQPLKINDASRVSGEHRVPIRHSAPSGLQHRCRTQGERLSYEGRASWPAGLVFQLPLDLDITRNFGGDGWVLRDCSGPLEGGGVP